MKRLVILLLIFVLVSLLSYSVFMYRSKPQIKALTVIETTTSSPSPTPLTKAQEEDKLWSSIQDWRKSENLNPYIEDPRLCAIAKDRSLDPPDNHATFYKKYSAYPYVLQENAVYDTNYYPKDLKGWLNSAPHAATLRKPYKYSCLECTNTTCIQIFSNL